MDHGAVAELEEENRELGQRISRLRDVRGMSLRALAAASGLSAGFLSLLENGRSNASIGSLRKIAAALGVSPAQLLDDSAVHTRGVLRAADRPQVPLDGATKHVVSQPPLRNLEVYVGTFQPGGSTGPDAYTHGNAQEICVVIDGEVTFWLAEERFTMAKDDSIEYLSSVAHRVVNESERPATVLWINSPPTDETGSH